MYTLFLYFYFYHREFWELKSMYLEGAQIEQNAREYIKQQGFSLHRKDNAAPIMIMLFMSHRSSYAYKQKKHTSLYALE